MRKGENGWEVLRHFDMVQALSRHDLFSNNVSVHPAVPNGMDPPRHTVFRQIIDTYFKPCHIQRFELTCRELAANRWANLPAGVPFDLMEQFAHPYALDAQCAFVGWPKSTQDLLKQWLLANQAATRNKDRKKLEELAAEFSALVQAQLDRRHQQDPGLIENDVTTRLIKEKVEQRPLTSEEITSILRNWTVGELGTMASSVGILAEFLAREKTIQTQLRQQPNEIPYAIDEVLRINPPLLSNRRVVTQPTSLGGYELQEGERLNLLWGEANQDPEVFPNPRTFQCGRDQSRNLLYGSGIHVCPGAPLARLELRTAVEVMLTSRLSLTSPEAEKADPPAAGWSKLWLRLEPRS